jgi:hypothetical protein
VFLINFSVEPDIDNLKNPALRLYVTLTLHFKTVKRILPILILVLVFLSCDNQRKLEPDSLAEQACECFGQQGSGTIDQRLNPCLSKPINENIEEIHKYYHKDEPLENAVQSYSMDVLILMIGRCDKLYDEFDLMYTNFYKEIERETIREQLASISDSLSDDIVSDSLKIKLLHTRISLLTQARDFDEAILDIHTLRTKYHRESETHLVTAYILRAQGKYDEAIVELDKAIDSGDKGYVVFKELVKRKIRQATTAKKRVL